MTKNSTTARAQFEALHIPESDWTPAMQLAVKQKWSSLPVDEKVDVLRTRLAAVTLPVIPEEADLAAQGHADPAAERKRLKRNAAVNAWRQRNQIQAALDARELRFAAMRAKRHPKKASTSAAAPLANAS